MLSVGGRKSAVASAAIRRQVMAAVQRLQSCCEVLGLVLQHASLIVVGEEERGVTVALSTLESDTRQQWRASYQRASTNCSHMGHVAHTWVMIGHDVCSVMWWNERQ